jgi:hypothetical protein
MRVNNIKDGSADVTSYLGASLGIFGSGKTVFRLVVGPFLPCSQIPIDNAANQRHWPLLNNTCNGARYVLTLASSPEFWSLTDPFVLMLGGSASTPNVVNLIYDAF